MHAGARARTLVRASSDVCTVQSFFTSQSLHNTKKIKKKSGDVNDEENFPFFFCFIRELNPHPLLTFSLYPPIRPYCTHHPPRANSNSILRPYLLPPPIPPSKSLRQKHGTADLSKKIHYNTKRVTTKPTQVNLLNAINTQTFSELIHELLNILYILYLLNILYLLSILYSALLINPTLVAFFSLCAF